ncbi:DUF1707 domain-containing protein [Nonomuraea spiralis]|uniref:DUF1707 domain-containing protein n=1 Tax=Nonomuraea spiralis TaxID=46182 RepID=A0ABV5IGQ4_9ACTN|nr:DUF1707 domain-containing protein [Nonomuraea spiralis]
MDHNDLRIGDAEREQTMAALREHFAQGRLTHEELDERLDRALASKTVRDLSQVTADLPGQAPAYSPGYAPAQQLPQFDRDAWRDAMRAHRQQMRAMHHGQAGRRWNRHQGHGRGHHGPGPFLPFLIVFGVLGLVFGFGFFKILLAVFLVATVFNLVHRRFHYRG